MEVGKIGQGGQASYEQPVQKQDKPKVVTQEEAVANTVDESGKPVDEKELKNAVDKLAKFLSDDNTTIEYQFHDKFKQDLMIKMVNKQTNEVILEVPPKRILDLVAKMMEMVGVFFDHRA